MGWILISLLDFSKENFINNNYSFSEIFSQTLPLIQKKPHRKCSPMIKMLKLSNCNRINNDTEINTVKIFSANKKVQLDNEWVIF